MNICRIYADFCMYAVAFLLSFLIFVCELYQLNKVDTKNNL
jgi:hypothetical protein